jgi:predicted DNA-binding transcriptional regulator AlpA
METTTTCKPSRLLRLNQVLDRIPVSKTAWYEGIKEGRYPSALSLAPRTSAWLESDIDALIERLEQRGAEHVQ